MTPEEYKEKSLKIALNLQSIALLLDDESFKKVSPKIKELETEINDLFEIIKELTKENLNGKKA